MEEVECAECGNRYDSEVETFCPRCGNEGLRRGARPALAVAAFDPRRRRVRIGGVILATMGAFALLQALWSVAVPADLDDGQLDALADIDLFTTQPGGDLHLRIVQNGTPVDADLAFSTVDGTPIANLTTSGGWANVTGLQTAFGNVTATVGNTTHSWRYYVPSGQSLTADGDLDGDAAWIAIKEIPATRIIAGFLAFFAAFVVLGGVAAIRLRWRAVAIAGAVLAVVPTIMMAAVVPVAGIILAVPSVLALLFIVQGRRHFA